MEGLPCKDKKFVGMVVPGWKKECRNAGMQECRNAGMQNNAGNAGDEMNRKPGRFVAGEMGCGGKAVLQNG